MIIYGKERTLTWDTAPDGTIWVKSGQLWGGGTSRENALADLADQIEYIESGSYDRAHESWCEHFRKEPNP